MRQCLWWKVVFELEIVARTFLTGFSQEIPKVGKFPPDLHRSFPQKSGEKQFSDYRLHFFNRKRDSDEGQGVASACPLSRNLRFCGMAQRPI
jgi:hypothetical protein